MVIIFRIEHQSIRAIDSGHYIGPFNTYSGQDPSWKTLEILRIEAGLDRNWSANHPTPSDDGIFTHETPFHWVFGCPDDLAIIYSWFYPLRQGLIEGGFVVREYHVTDEYIPGKSGRQIMFDPTDAIKVVTHDLAQFFS